MVLNSWNDMDYVILDTETTGLTPTSEILEVAVIDKHGNVLLNTLVKPKGRIPAKATEIHGIHRATVKDSPTFPEVWEKQLYPIIKDRKVLIYNAKYDVRLIKQSLEKWGIVTDNITLDTDCVMDTYARLIGSKRWVTLEKACGYKIEHRALGDCLATLKVIQKNTKLDFQDKEEELAVKQVEVRQEVAVTQERTPEPYKKPSSFWEKVKRFFS